MKPLGSLCLALFVITPSIVFAHGGPKNKFGCHSDKGYHCHDVKKTVVEKKDPKRDHGLHIHDYRDVVIDPEANKSAIVTAYERRKAEKIVMSADEKAIGTLIRPRFRKVTSQNKRLKYVATRGAQVQASVPKKRLSYTANTIKPQRIIIRRKRDAIQTTTDNKSVALAKQDTPPTPPSPQTLPLSIPNNARATGTRRGWTCVEGFHRMFTKEAGFQCVQVQK